MTFGQRLKTLRNSRRISQRYLAAEAGVSDAFVCQLEQGQTSPSAQTLECLADVLGVTMDGLWRGTGGDKEGGER